MKIMMAVVLVMGTLAVTAAQSLSTETSQLRVLYPAGDSAISGAVTLRAAVDGTPTPTDVIFFGDGRQLCTVAKPPYECDWDAGPTITDHVVRVVATLPDGSRLVESVRTRNLSQTALFSMKVDAVQLAVTVEDTLAGARLPQSAFHVFEDGAAQQIASFEATNVPLDLVVAVDTSTSMTPAMRTLKAAVKAFLAAVPAQASVTVTAFSDDIVDVTGPAAAPADRDAHVDALAAHGATRLYDVIVRSITTLQGGKGRKAILVFTDGEDEGSRVSLSQVERRLQSTDVALYMIGQGRGAQMENLQKIMKRLVEPTGGRAYFTKGIDGLSGVFRQLLDELSRQYLLAYNPKDTTRDGRWRRVKVTVDGHHRVRAREGYRLDAAD